jgi:hypothetical protein
VATTVCDIAVLEELVELEKDAIVSGTVFLENVCWLVPTPRSDLRLDGD